MTENCTKLLEKIDLLIRLTAISALKDKNLTEQVEILTEMGIQPKQISKVLGADYESVRTLKQRIKKRKQKKAK